MFPYLVAAIVVGLPTIYVAVRYREYRKFLAGAFLVSSGMQFYFNLVKLPVPLICTSTVQSPELSAVRGTIHFVLFLLSVFRVVLPRHAPRWVILAVPALRRLAPFLRCLAGPAVHTPVPYRSSRADYC
ncbi:hypothetical protein [Bradyrhizobium archetypum]|uniref:hypothetical protein n=1 Tax=Bradyrhizobium archetypum TaxID=2721160 RepID=UPI001AED9158|nr:hypothetical protein [Bradyrhizobium archetypum]